ncbi:MAG: TetR/AcrR family transcriptional regulator [Actinomycetota bacterium]|nr:TetR/AcrR family transcriptional regulator [Actinomycetota bacterium]
MSRAAARSSGSGRRARMSGKERREQLIGVARAVFAERGFEAASIEEIAERAAVSKPVVYQHFGGKEGLYAVVVDREVGHLLALITAALEADHPRLAVEQAATAFLAYIEKHQEGFRILVRDAPVGTSTGTLPSIIRDVAANAESLLAAEFGQRGYDPDVAPVYARALVGMVALVGEWWLDAGTPKRQEVAAHLANLAWNGLKALDPQPTLMRLPS